MLTACGGNSRQKTTAGVPDMHNAENALDYQGTYKVGIGLPAPEYYKVEENRLRRLNAKKQPITGELADQYVLTK